MAARDSSSNSSSNTSMMRKRKASEVADYHQFPCRMAAATTTNPLLNCSTITATTSSEPTFLSSTNNPQPLAVYGFSGLPLFPPTNTVDVTIAPAISNSMDDTSLIDGIIRDLIHTSSNVFIPQLIREIIYPNFGALLEYRLLSPMDPHPLEIKTRKEGQQQGSSGLTSHNLDSTLPIYSLNESCAISQYLSWRITPPPFTNNVEKKITSTTPTCSARDNKEKFQQQERDELEGLHLLTLLLKGYVGKAGELVPRNMCCAAINSTEPYQKMVSAFQVFNDISSFIKYSHFTANQAIQEAFEREKRVHIIDFDIMQGLQWPGLFHILSLREGGPPHVRLMGLGTSLEALEVTGKRLSDFADKMGLLFEFYPVADKVGNLDPKRLNVSKREALTVHWLQHSLYDVTGSDTNTLWLLQRQIIFLTRLCFLCFIVLTIVH
ncbi:hypothetical protein PTKIN_Ptkin09bG0295600 [Pterospermum kingtungense]